MPAKTTSTTTKTKKKKEDNNWSLLPLQGDVLQAWDSAEDPVHARPPFLGAGLEHVLVLLLTPPPQVFVHVDHGRQAPQFPLTGTENFEGKFEFEKLKKQNLK